MEISHGGLFEIDVDGESTAKLVGNLFGIHVDDPLVPTNEVAIGNPDVARGSPSLCIDPREDLCPRATEKPEDTSHAPDDPQCHLDEGLNALDQVRARCDKLRQRWQPELCRERQSDCEQSKADQREPPRHQARQSGESPRAAPKTGRTRGRFGIRPAAAPPADATRNGLRWQMSLAPFRIDPITEIAGQRQQAMDTTTRKPMLLLKLSGSFLLR